jgi:4-alpha-glucanotransferase
MTRPEVSMSERRSGILLHITSLPSRFGIGDIGPEAYRFVDLLASAGQRCWQILPLSPTSPGAGNSPYHSMSAFAHNPLLISPECIVNEGILDAADLKPFPTFPEDHVDYEAVTAYKERLFDRAYRHFQVRGGCKYYDRFCKENAYWLNDFALFVSLSEHFRGKAWNHWPPELRERDPSALASAEEQFAENIARVMFLQCLFARQWELLRQYCRERGIVIIGDIPIYVTHNSADVWAMPEIFNLDRYGNPVTVAGVPPDYFSATGQLWGNPVYRWDVLRKRGYDWWIRRIEHNRRLVDLIRIDHFRGFAGFWEVPAREKTAMNGRWSPGPGADFFRCLLSLMPTAAIIAEDLGVITPDVEALKEQFNLPGMRVLLFAFGEGLPANPHIPHNHVPNSIVYTGTHDNNTARGWYDHEASPGDRNRLARYLGRDVSSATVHRELIRLAMSSVARTAIIPMQDLLGLGADARMNTPGTSNGNWRWRLRSDQVSHVIAADLLEMTRLFWRA